MNKQHTEMEETQDRDIITSSNTVTNTIDGTIAEGDL